MAMMRPKNGRLPVTANPAGGFTPGQIPDPNKDYYASHLQQGVSSMNPMASTKAGNPAISGTGESALSQNLGLATRGRQQREAYDAAQREKNMFTMPRNVLPTMNVDALTQALFENRAGKVRTSGAAGYDDPGFFDNQLSPEEAAMRGREDYLRSQDLARLSRR